MVRCFPCAVTGTLPLPCVLLAADVADVARTAAAELVENALRDEALIGMAGVLSES